MVILLLATILFVLQNCQKVISSVINLKLPSVYNVHNEINTRLLLFVKAL